MYLVIRKSDHTVFGAQFTCPPQDAFNPERFEIREWHGAGPAIHDPDNGVYSYDPTLDNPDYADFADASSRFDELCQQIGEEIAWLENALDVVDDADLATLRIILKHVLRENLQMLRAWRYVARRFDRS